MAQRSALGIVERLLDAVAPPRAVYAHCDIPCGIYDPHEAQIAALTVVRMDQLIAELVHPAADAKPEERSLYLSKIARYTSVKETHSEKVKHEIRVIWETTSLRTTRSSSLRRPSSSSRSSSRRRRPVRGRASRTPRSF